MKKFTIPMAMLLLAACVSPTAEGTAAPGGAAPATAAPSASEPQLQKCQTDWDCGTGSCIDQVCRK